MFKGVFIQIPSPLWLEAEDKFPYWAETTSDRSGVTFLTFGKVSSEGPNEFTERLNWLSGLHAQEGENTLWSLRVLFIEATSLTMGLHGL